MYIYIISSYEIIKITGITDFPFIQCQLSDGQILCDKLVFPRDSQVEWAHSQVPYCDIIFNFLVFHFQCFSQKKSQSSPVTSLSSSPAQNSMSTSPQMSEFSPQMFLQRFHQSVMIYQLISHLTISTSVLSLLVEVRR